MSAPDNLSLREHIFADIDRWVSACGKLFGALPYVESEYVPVPGPPTSPSAYCGIQQVREEIVRFVDVLIERNLRGTILEIGLGFFGSTHRLWRHIFQNVCTIEMDPKLVQRFAANMVAFDGTNALADGRSRVIVGNSHLPSTVPVVYDALRQIDVLFLRQIDVLFLDGDHSYGPVLCDWLLYHELVRPGGIIAFHDSACRIEPDFMVHRFIERLGEGTIDGRKRRFEHIIASKSAGISFYEVD